MERNLLCAFWTLFVVCVSGSSDNTLELPAMEYFRHLDKDLSLGQCADRLVPYPQGPIPLLCTYPNRNGRTLTKEKPVLYSVREDVHNTTELLKYLPLCDSESASYFGLLARGDCLATEVAQKLSFSPKTAVLLSLEHYRPRLRYLKADPKLNIPDEFTHYLENYYYTEKINIGTEEAIILELWFKQSSSAEKAKFKNSQQSLSEILFELLNSSDRPRKVKVIRISTSEKVFKSTVFKGNLKEALEYVEKCEKEIERMKNEFRYNIRRTPLSYTFKQYEVGVVALPYSTVTDEQKRQAWEEVALLQVEAKRIYTTNKRYRKFCRSSSLTTKYQKYCLLTKQTLKELKKTITQVHTQRRDWNKLAYETQLDYITSLRSKLTLLGKRMRLVARHLRKAMKGKRS